MTIKGYLTNLGKYNEGELVGEWITFPIDEDELNEVFERIGIDGVQYEEYFFTDWDVDFSNDFGEYENIDRINEIAERLEDWDEDTFKAACEIWSVSEVLDHDADDYILYDDVKDEYSLGYYWIQESGCYNLDSMGNLANYFDYEAFGRDVAMEANGGFTSYGWIEYRG